GSAGLSARLPRSLRLTLRGASGALHLDDEIRHSNSLAVNQSGPCALAVCIPDGAAGAGSPLPQTSGAHPSFSLLHPESRTRAGPHVTTTINTGHPLMNTHAERMRIRAALRHLGSGADLRDFPATASEKIALVKTASQRKLVAWNRSRGCYELTAAGWCELAPSRRFGVGSMLVGSAAGATIGAVALAAFWVISGASHQAALRTAAAPPGISKRVASLSAPAVTGATASLAPLSVGPVAVQTASPT